jgi:RNA polymerase-binding protein DksA
MANALTDAQIAEFRSQLQNRLRELREGVRDEVERSDSEHFTDVAGEVHDPEEVSVANLVIDLDLASIDRHVNEIREVEAALLRIGRGEFGVCIDCEQPIPLARLKANPTAERCIACQTDHDRAEALEVPPHSTHRSL